MFVLPNIMMKWFDLNQLIFFLLATKHQNQSLIYLITPFYRQQLATALFSLYIQLHSKSLQSIFQIKEMENTNHQSEMLKYINLARQFPAYFISLIDKQLASFVNQREMPICEDVIYETNEGKSAWKQARKFLQRQTTLLPFELHEGLNMSAKDHASDLAKHGIFGHTGSDKSTFSERILKHCKKGQGAMAEIIGADFLIKKRNNAEMTILGLIIDDGVSDRGHRKTIFNPEYRYIGCKSQVQNDKLITVFNLTQNKLEIRGRPSTSVSYGNSTAPCFKKEVTVQKEDKNAKTSSYLFNHPTQQDRTSKIQQQRPVFQEISKNVSPLKGFAGQTTKYEGKSKKISQKKQNTKTWNQQGCKITQKITQILYSDGTTQENIQKHTVYC